MEAFRSFGGCTPDALHDAIITGGKIKEWTFHEQGIQVDADNIENQPDVDFDKMREERDAMIKQRQKEMEEIRQRKNKRAIQRQEKKKAREEKRLQEESLKNQPKEAPVKNGENQ